MEQNTTTCGQDAAYRYTWPGRDESFICEEHSSKLRAVASAVGLPLQLIPVEPEGQLCAQKMRQ